MAEPVDMTLQISNKQNKCYRMKDLTRASSVNIANIPPIRGETENLVPGRTQQVLSQKQQEVDKTEQLSRELAAEKARSTQLMEELEQSRRMNEELIAGLTERDASRSDFERDNRFSSTRRAPGASNLEESRFYTSINQLSISSINIPECKPDEDGEIHRQSFEAWKDLLVDSMTLAGIEDEVTKFMIFKVKSGARLLEIFRNTRSVEEDPNVNDFPFANAISRLKSYFGSGSDVMLMRRKLALLNQKPDESDLSYITRVGSVARLCEFEGSKEFEQIVATIAEHATNCEVRTASLKMLSRKQCFTDLVDKVREIEAIKLNEEFVRNKYANPGHAVVASVSASFSKSANRPFNFNPQRNFQNYGNRPLRGGFRAPRGRQYYTAGGTSLHPSRNEKCWRCNSIYHAAHDCSHRDKKCNYCGINGHIQRACRSRSNGPGIKRPTAEPLENTPRKIALIDEVKDDTESIQPMRPKSERNLATLHNPTCKTSDGFNVLPNTVGKISIWNIAQITDPSNNDQVIKRDDAIITATVSGMQCIFMIDSGAQVNTCTEAMFKDLTADINYKRGLLNIQFKSDKSLKAYATEGHINVLATFHAPLYVSRDRPTYIEKFYVVKEARALLGRPTASRYSILMLGLQVPLQPLAEHAFDELYPGEIATVAFDGIFPKFNVPPVKIYYDTSKPPCRTVFTNIPLAVKPLVEKRLQNLVSADIIERVVDGMDTSFCSSMLVVPKGKDDIRLVIDLRGPNRYIQRTPFPIPTLEKIVAELDGAKWFSTIDLSNAFFHIELHQESRHLTNFFTEFGMFRCVRLPFGLCNAPDIFQETLQRTILAGCKGCINYLDDCLIFGGTKEEHDENLANVLACLANHNVRLNKDKCVFGSQSVRFIGFQLTPDGWQIEEEKAQAIKNFRQPNCTAEVKSFLGLITFVDRFIVHRATKSEHLRNLANSETFYWTDKENEEFSQLKNEISTSIKRLGYYNVTDRIELFVDASPVGLGAVLTQINEMGLPRVIACASKSLSLSEKRYPQTQKEALAVVWGVERFSYYLLTRTFTIRTDAEAIQYIFDANHRLGKRAISRAESWALRLQPYDYEIKRVPGNKNIADALSRLILATQESVPFEEDKESHYLYSLDSGNMVITWNEIEMASENDSELLSVREALMSNKWPADLRPYEAQKPNLRSLGSMVFKDDRVILPNTLRRKALESAHGGHIGEVAMKRVMREYFWWPRMSTEITRFMKDCNTCVQLSRRNPPLPLCSRELPEGPWQMLQVDFLAVPTFGTGEFLVVIDTYSRYLYVVEMKTIDTVSTNSALNEVFRMWGYPSVIQSDNGPPFQSSGFVKYWEDRGVKVRKSVPLSPQSNGAVERQNSGIIKALSASKLDGSNWRLALQQYVHRHNTLIPHSRLLVTPFELMVGWKYKGNFPGLTKSFNYCDSSKLDRTTIYERDTETKLASKQYADRVRGAKDSKIDIGDTVLLAHKKKNKTDPTFSSDRFEVVARDGAKVVLMSRSGIQYARNVQDVKLAPTPVLNQSGGLSYETVDSEKQAQYTQEATTADPVPLEGESRNLRQRSSLRPPARFDEEYIYRVFY
ncbi:uncharacterized protein LOC131694724 [Topomyia yanbarensis]|uniref:uncharacterized protein LOC131687334 n=1 Tax=Topomyia yanbarensis TaxID=2498891 RepID=UPI00273B0D46|nr:uncharacterized protein LOC131687334 [Topomyia yanbarensis]XP_058839186.1 uncharacterized protein LOC131694724 [Topomyia yanbarensis]